MFGVYDGHGGREVAAFVRDSLPAIVKQSPYFAQDRMELALENAYYQIDLELATEEGQQRLLGYREGQTAEEKRMPRFMEDEKTIGTAQFVGTTAVTCLIHKNKVFTANLGDSRAVMGIDSGKRQKLNKSSSDKTSNSCPPEKTLAEAVALSNDHKPSNKVEVKRITEAGGTVDRDNRVNGSLAMSRSLGDLSYKSDGKLPSHKQLISNQCQMTVNKVTSKCKFILIACDGIWDCMDNEMAVRFID